MPKLHRSGEFVKNTAAPWCLSLAVFALVSCSTPGLKDTGRVAIVNSDALPVPTMSDLTAGERPHYVGPFDQISVDVLGLPELSRQVRVDADGNFALPLAGSIEVAGKSPEELATLIEQRLRGSYVRNPQVTVTVNDTVSQTMTVEGEVRTPGIFPVTGRMTLLKAIARAQGTTDIASTNHVVVFRRVSGQSMAALYDLRAIRLAAYEDPLIYTNDVIVVGESNARRLFPQILQAAGLIVAPVVTILSRN